MMWWDDDRETEEREEIGRLKNVPELVKIVFATFRPVLHWIQRNFEMRMQRRFLIFPVEDQILNETCARMHLVSILCLRHKITNLNPEAHDSSTSRIQNSALRGRAEFTEALNQEMTIEGTSI